MKQKIVLVLGLLVTLGAFFWIFKDIKFSELLDALKSFDLIWLIPSLFLFYWSMYLRGSRWGLLFRPERDFDGRRMFRPLMIGFAFNCVLPGRVGEFARAYFVAKKEDAGLPASLGTVVTERIFDAVTLLVFLSASLALLPAIDPSVQVDFWGTSVQGSMLAPLMRKIVMMSVVLIVGVGIFMIPRVQMLLIALPYMFKRVPDKYKALASNAVRDLSKGFTAIRDPKTLAIVVFYSLAIWGLAGASTLVLSYGFDGMKMTFTHALAVMALIAIFILIPAAPGYWGLYEAGTIFSLTVFAISPDQSVSAAYAIVLHLVQYVPIVMVGFVFAAQSQVSIRPPAAQSAENN